MSTRYKECGKLQGGYYTDEKKKVGSEENHLDVPNSISRM